MEHIINQDNNVDHIAISQLVVKAKDSKKVNVSTFLIIIFICFLFSAGFVIFSGCLSDSSTAIELDGKININKASAVSMMRLPGIGVSKAEAIVLYRENCDRQKAFKCSQDLTLVHGIGVKTADSVKQYIRFE